MRDSKAWTIIGLLYGIFGVLVLIATLVALGGCNNYVSPTEPMTGAQAAANEQAIPTSVQDDIFASGVNTPLTINQQQGPPRFVCNSNENRPPWCDDNNWTEDKPPGLQP